MTRIKEAMDWAARQLKANGISTSALDMAVLLGFVTGRSLAGLYQAWWEPMSPEEESRFSHLVARRGEGEPVAYLVGHKEFMGLEFAVSPVVLIPRPETELLVEKALDLLKEKPKAIAVDVGTGSGAIAVSLAVNLPGLTIYATDLLSQSLAVAQENALRHGVDQRIAFMRGDLTGPLRGDMFTGQVDLIAANLPYIATEDLADLPRDVRQYEPMVALDGGADGLDLCRRLIPEAENLLKPGGKLLMEIGYNQGASVAAMLHPPIWRDVQVEKDLAGLDRLVVATSN